LQSSGDHIAHESSFNDNCKFNWQEFRQNLPSDAGVREPSLPLGLWNPDPCLTESLLWSDGFIGLFDVAQFEVPSRTDRSERPHERASSQNKTETE
jgi:hypothetical protein